MYGIERDRANHCIYMFCQRDIHSRPYTHKRTTTCRFVVSKCKKNINKDRKNSNRRRKKKQTTTCRISTTLWNGERWKWFAYECIWYKINKISTYISAFERFRRKRITMCLCRIFSVCFILILVQFFRQIILYIYMCVLFFGRMTCT